MKTIAVKNNLSILGLVLIAALLGGLTYLGFAIDNYGAIILGIVFLVLIVLALVFNILQKTVLVSSDDNGIVINGVFKKKRLEWYQVGYIDFKRYHNRYFSVSYGKLIISLPENKKLKIHNVSNVKMAYDKLLNAKKEHYEKVD